MHYFMFLFVCVVWGTSFILMKYASVVFEPLTVGGGRVMGGAIFLALMLGTVGCLKKRRERGVRFGVIAKKRVRFMWKRHGLGLLIPAFIGLGYPFAMQPYLIGKYENSSFFGMMMCLVPVLTICASVVMLGVWPRIREIVGVIGGGVGIWMLFGDAVERDITILDFCFAVSVPLCYAVSNTFVKKKLGELPPAVLGAWALGLAGIVILPLGLGSETMTMGTGLQITWAVMCILILGVIGSGLAMWMMYEMVQKRGPLFAGMVTYLVCGFAVIWGWVDGEEVTSGQLVALVVIWAMVALVQWPAKKKAAVEADEMIGV
ncbi:DMT family transporter [Planctomycetota bacterium]|nr:DMT family transporter [Planctomycetota bacterium]